MQIPNFNKQLLNMSLTLLSLQMKLGYWDYSGSYSFVMSFVNHSWPAVYRMKLRLSSFFLRLLSFFPPERITILFPERLITCTNKRVRDINTKFHRLFFISNLQLPLHFPPGNYIRIVYTRNCHLIIMKLVLSWKNELKSCFFGKWSAQCSGWERRRLNPTCFHPWMLSSLFQTQEMITTAISCIS